ncbi:uncharacterized protein M421DRAFT_10294 [Didymella exigua CBS 183.55]|uniref:Uncharacterized protein n=1 Tax=Didymella exigua CBS 183.55 TaxID=1150837 RepID=A0A6A5R3V1_9PLEO|nr:uncharacterized protein M421DRAFT_10294 [Didymella exigua CBS 183.55]KAF1922751.1 hypothetical protein M421DRAFT_10294 [Didymella exigua CBS 183.55]
MDVRSPNPNTLLPYILILALGGLCTLASRSTIVSRTARALLILHGLLNVAQGFYCLLRPCLGALGVGWYQFVFACQNNRALISATIPLRINYAAVVYRSMGGAARRTS